MTGRRGCFVFCGAATAALTVAATALGQTLPLSREYVRLSGGVVVLEAPIPAN